MDEKYVKPTRHKFSIDEFYEVFDCDLKELTTTDSRIFLSNDEINIGTLINGTGSFSGIGGPGYFGGDGGGDGTTIDFGNVFGGSFGGITIIDGIGTIGNTSTIAGVSVEELEQIIEILRKKLEGLQTKYTQCLDLLSQLQNTQFQIGVINDEYDSLIKMIEDLLVCKKRFEEIVKLKSNELTLLKANIATSRSRYLNLSRELEVRQKGLWTDQQNFDEDAVTNTYTQSVTVSSENTNVIGVSFDNVRNAFEVVFNQILTNAQKSEFSSQINVIRTSLNKEDVREAWATIAVGLNPAQTTGAFGLPDSRISTLSQALALL